MADTSQSIMFSFTESNSSSMFPTASLSNAAPLFSFSGTPPPTPRSHSIVHRTEFLEDLSGSDTEIDDDELEEEEAEVVEVAEVAEVEEAEEAEVENALEDEEMEDEDDEDDEGYEGSEKGDISPSELSSEGEEDNEDPMEVDLELMRDGIAQMDFSDQSSDDASDHEDEDEEGIPDEPNPNLPPHFKSPLYKVWLASRKPNILFAVSHRRPLFGIVTAHIWYTDYSQHCDFIAAIVQGFGLSESDICGYSIRVKRRRLCFKFGAMEENWQQIIKTIRDPLADEMPPGSHSSVRADLRFITAAPGVDAPDGVVQMDWGGVPNEDDDPDR